METDASRATEPIAMEEGTRCASGEVLTALRELIDLASAAPEQWSFVGDTIRLLDTEVEGVRCTLERSLPAPTSQHALSPREREIAEMLARGMSNKAIAQALDISTFTVASHLRRMFVKLNCSSRAGVVGTLAHRRDGA
jgi:DNA-binding CsgD family transcriptional regulator